MNTIQLSFSDLFIAALLVLIPGIASLALHLGLLKRLAVASVRTVVQLALLALLLEWVFELQRLEWIAAVLLSMILNAGLEAVRRTERRFLGIWSTGITSVTLSSVITTAVVVELIIGVEPWYQPRYVIPLLGMVLGNTLTGISLALERIMSDIDEKRAAIETWLAHGATAWEASRRYIADAIRVGMVPILNSMSVVGIVSLPGMMTGQILAGASPDQAVRYQVVVMFMVAGATGIGTVLAVLLAFRRLTTPYHQLAVHRLRGTAQ